MHDNLDNSFLSMATLVNCFNQNIKRSLNTTQSSSRLLLFKCSDLTSYLSVHLSCVVMSACMFHVLNSA